MADFRNSLRDDLDRNIPDDQSHLKMTLIEAMDLAEAIRRAYPAYQNQRQKEYEHEQLEGEDANQPLLKYDYDADEDKSCKGYLDYITKYSAGLKLILGDSFTGYLIFKLSLITHSNN